jgi:LytS/YehU family sensor histidine kinase
MQIALVVDMCFYFTGLAYRDRQVEKDKIIFQQQLITQLEANETLQEKFRSELEQQVEEKTKELIEQRKVLETEKEAKLLADFNRKFSESELKALRSQMNPHFVFNILNTIESYTLENNKEGASLMIQKFSKLTRLVLENSMNQLVPFENDWKSLQLYIELEQMRYADKFSVAYNVHQQIQAHDYLIPPMIIQPFVENAIIHGLRNRQDANGKLNLSADFSNEYIIVHIEDNGIGRVRAAELKVDNPIQKYSLGIKVTQDRISMFNNLNQNTKANVEIQDLSEGTRVVIRLPVTIF